MFDWPTTQRKGFVSSGIFWKKNGGVLPLSEARVYSRLNFLIGKITRRPVYPSCITYKSAATVEIKLESVEYISTPHFFFYYNNFNWLITESINLKFHLIDKSTQSHFSYVGILSSVYLYFFTRNYTQRRVLKHSFTIFRV